MDINLGQLHNNLIVHFVSSLFCTNILVRWKMLSLVIYICAVYIVIINTCAMQACMLERMPMCVCMYVCIYVCIVCMSGLTIHT